MYSCAIGMEKYMRNIIAISRSHHDYAAVNRGHIEDAVTVIDARFLDLVACLVKQHEAEIGGNIDVVAVKRHIIHAFLDIDGGVLDVGQVHYGAVILVDKVYIGVGVDNHEIMPLMIEKQLRYGEIRQVAAIFVCACLVSLLVVRVEAAAGDIPHVAVALEDRRELAGYRKRPPRPCGDRCTGRSQSRKENEDEYDKSLEHQSDVILVS